MTRIPPEFDFLNQMADMDVGRLTEHEARAILEDMLWPNGPVCPHCNSAHVTRIAAKSAKIREGLLQCNDCRKQFTVTTRTVMHRSHVTLKRWVQAVHFMVFSACFHQKEISALQLQRFLGLKTYRSALRLTRTLKARIDEWKSSDTGKEFTKAHRRARYDEERKTVSVAHGKKEARRDYIASYKRDEQKKLFADLIEFIALLSGGTPAHLRRYRQEHPEEEYRSNPERWLKALHAKQKPKVLTVRDFLGFYRNHLDDAHRAIFDDALQGMTKAKKLLPPYRYYEAKKMYRSLAEFVVRMAQDDS